MRRFSLVSTLCLAASLSSMVACAASSDVEEDTESTESEVKKKVKPKGGNGAFDLTKPSWSTTGAVGGYVFSSQIISIDSRTEKVPGTYNLSTPNREATDGVVTMGQNSDEIVIGAGMIVRRKVTGLRVRYDQPLTLGGSRYDMQPIPSGFAGFLKADGAWAKKAKGAFMLVTQGKVQVTSSADPTPTELTLAEGVLNEVVLPTARVSVQLDAIDPHYPTPGEGCRAPFLFVRASGEQQWIAVRDEAGNAIPTAVIPHGPRVTATVEAYGMTKTLPTSAGQTLSFVLNRLEVVAAGGATQHVQGTFNVEFKDSAGRYQPSPCPNIRTGRGLDLLDGTYRVTSRAQTASGTVTHVEEVSFP